MGSLVRAQEGEQATSPVAFFMQPVVYILYSHLLDKFYIGKSENFAQRLLIHNSGENEKWSRSGRPWIEFLVIPCVTFAQAGKMERYIKAQKSRKYIQALKEDFFLE
jgi:putative endonuclease